MLRPADGDEIAAAFGLGAARSLTGPVARGEEGQVWRLETAAGTWAVKETFDPLDAADVAEIATFQEAAAAAGVTTPPVVRTPAGAAARTVAGTQVRVYGWVDLLPPDRLVDAAAVGRLLAAIHRTGFEGTSPVHPWYSEPVGEARWPLRAGRRAGCSRRAVRWRADGSLRRAGRARGAARAAGRPGHLPPRPVGRQRAADARAGELYVIDWDNWGLAGVGQEVALVLCEFTAGSPGADGR